MGSHTSRSSIGRLASCMLMLAASTGPAGAVGFATIQSFSASPDGYLGSALIPGTDIVYGSTYYAPSGAWGQVFSLTKPASGTTYTRANLATLAGSTSAGDQKPAGQLYRDAAGLLYGTTSAGGLSTTTCKSLGNSGCGTAFKLTPPATAGGSWTKTVLYSFKGGSDGQLPLGGLIADAAGNLYGVTRNGGGASACLSGCGTVFKLTKPATSGGSWTESVIYAFQGGSDGISPNPRLLLGADGNLYGTTRNGGTTVAACETLINGFVAGCGTVFMLTPPASGTTWTKTILHSFANTKDGSAPQSGLATDANGNLYGATVQGGTAASQCIGAGLSGCGVIYRLSKPSTAGANWRFTALYTFSAANTGIAPLGVIRDRNGNLYGAAQFTPSGHTCAAASYYCGEVFKLAKPAAGSTTWTYTALHTFANGNDGAQPVAPIIGDSAGLLYGVTTYGSTSKVFRITASGYKP